MGTITTGQFTKTVIDGAYPFLIFGTIMVIWIVKDIVRRINDHRANLPTVREEDQASVQVKNLLSLPAILRWRR